jgi:hypothetical protein
MEIESRFSQALLPEEPPPFARLLTGSLAPALSRGEVPRGLDWVIRKHEIPFDILVKLQRAAYPGASESITRAAWEVQALISGLADLLLDWRTWLDPSEEKRRRAELLLEQLLQTPELLRVADWTAALMLSFDERRGAIEMLDREVASFGVGRVTQDADPVFGVFIYAEGGVHVPEYGPLEVGGHTFPVVVRRGQWRQDSASTVHPVNGTAACWASSASLPGDGFLTAAHLLPSAAIGDTLQTRAGLGRVIDIAPPGIDAMLVEPPGGAPTNITSRPRINPQPLVAPFIPAQFCGVSSGCVSTTVTNVTNMFGTLSPHIPGRVFLAHAGQGGDSGALIRGGSPVTGIGLYAGRFLDAAGVQHGYGMHLAQVAYCMSLDLYDL